MRDGDRVVLLGDGFIEREIHEGYLETALARRFPGSRIVFRNLGWTGDSVDVQMRPLSFGDLESHVTHQRPTVVLICYGMNDSFEGPGGIGRFREGYARILDIVSRKVLRSPPRPRIVLLSPIGHEALGPPFPDPEEHNRILALYVETVAEVAGTLDLLWIDLFRWISDESIEKPEAPLTESGIHLGPVGYWAAGFEVERGLGWEQDDWRLDLDLGSGRVSLTGTEASEEELSVDGFRLVLRDHRLPSPPSPSAAALSEGGPSPRRIRVSGLAEGVFELRVDGRTVAAAGSGEWEKGVVPAGGPEFDQVEELRRWIVKKNALFFHRWRPYNTEYIFGRRSEARGANVGNPQFADEMRKFDELIAEAEERIFDLTVPRERVYELVRTGSKDGPGNR